MRARRLFPVAAAVAAATALAACTSPPPPRPVAEDDRAARLSVLEAHVDALERERSHLVLRVAALEQALARARPGGDADLAARTAVLESRVAALEQGPRERPSGAGLAPAGGPRITIVDRRRAEASSLPAPGEPVRPFAAIDGESFSFARGSSLDLACLLGVEAPAKPGADEDEQDRDVLEEKLARQAKAWGREVVSSGEAWRRARERLEELLVEGELTFAYDAEHSEAREPSGKHRLRVLARVARRSGQVVLANEVLVAEGLALARGFHARARDLERLETEARVAKRGLWAGR